MKGVLSLAVLLGLWLTHIPAFAHKEWVHQYMVKQSYLYLENQIGTIPILRDAIGMNYHGEGNNSEPFSTPYPIGVGAWREDNEDIVYSYGGVRGGTPSITHFWTADKGDQDRSAPVFFYGYEAPNAYQKALIFLLGRDAQGQHEIKIKRANHYGSIRTYYITYNSLPNFYKGNYYLESEGDENGDYRVNYYHLPRFDPAFSQSAALQILGRAAHLLGDMSVPAHVHAHLHPCPLNRPDHYENDLGNTYYSNNNLNRCEQDPGGQYPAYNWTAATAAQQGGLISELYCQPNPVDQIRYLYYTVNQLADFFPSGVNYGDMGSFKRGGDQYFGQGNSHLPQGTNPYIENVYNSFGRNSPTSINTAQIADVNFNFTIRAVATLFQWFAYNAGIINDLKNQKIYAASGQTLICNGSSESFSAPSIPRTAAITWSVEPSYAGTGVVVKPQWWQFFPERYVVTPTSGFSGVLTVKATYASAEGCYAGPTTLKHQVWVGAPAGSIRAGREQGYLVCPSGVLPLEAEVYQPELQGGTSLQWSTTGGASLYYDPGNNPYVTVIAPGGYNQTFTVICTITNGCGESSATYREFMTADQNGIDGMPCQLAKPDKAPVTQVPTAAQAGDSDALAVFPNPSNTGFDLVVPAPLLAKKAESAQSNDLTYTLRDNLGRVVAQGTSKAATVHIDTRNLPVGMYSLSCSTNGQTFHRRVQVLH